MINRNNLTAANNTAVLSNVVEVCAHAISDVLGNGSSTIVDDTQLTVNVLREMTLRRISTHITEVNGG